MIRVELNVMMAKRNITTDKLAAKVGISPANISILKSGKAKTIRFSALEKICEALDC